MVWSESETATSGEWSAAGRSNEQNWSEMATGRRVVGGGGEVGGAVDRAEREQDGHELQEKGVATVMHARSSWPTSTRG